MKIKLIGTGAAGNKAAISILENNILEPTQVRLINSTLRDIPENYRQGAIQLMDSEGGCGKERNIGKDLMLNTLEAYTDDFKSFIDQDDEVLVIVTSSEGGTGSSTSSILADFYDSVVGIPVHLFIFTGFEDDGRGLQNTIELFQEVKESYVVESISNNKFLPLCGGNKLKAHKMANEEFCNRIKVLIADGIIDSEQNIDDMDLFKVSTTPGFMTIRSTEFSKIKNKESFDKILNELIDSDPSLDSQEKSAKRLAVFLNCSEESLNNIDQSFSVIKEKLGSPYELFTHFQYDESKSESISFIASGMKLPLDELNEVYEKYKKESEKVNKKEDTFFEFASSLEGNAEDNMFNTRRRRVGKSDIKTINDDSFFKKFNEPVKKNDLDNY